MVLPADLLDEVVVSTAILECEHDLSVSQIRDIVALVREALQKPFKCFSVALDNTREVLVAVRLVTGSLEVADEGAA
jgi:hypothetical protein